ncbi:hypothetical protein NDU88_005940 [Pleurodeles waltl]|uniref:Uncharacterized protein n=1 Tax=Pleurodeles waltl TaxID=8319 RepID=A0AAV7SN74_PLEWA|nr:hypothetical protein NDU88_005940 [Pleurodeles waltl]
MVPLNSRGAEETITVGMIPNLGEDLILCTDYVNFTPLLEKACQEHITNTWWEEAPFGTAEAACADAAASNPELEDGTTSPLGFPGLKGQRRTVRTPESEEKEKTPAGKGEIVEEAGEARKEDRRRSQQPVKSQNANGGGNQTESGPEVSAILTAAQEAHREVLLKLTQVRP